MVNQKILPGLKQALRFMVLVGLVSNANFSMAEPGFIGVLTKLCSDPNRTVAAAYEKDYGLIGGCVGCHSPASKNQGRTPLYTAYKNNRSSICPINVVAVAPPIVAPPANMPPTANAGGPLYTGSVGLAVMFNGAGSTDSDGTIMTYSWDFGDGETDTGPNPSHTYAAAKTSYTVSLSVTDNEGATDTATTTADIAASSTTPPQPPDTDKDGIADEADNCPMIANLDQLDADGDGIGDICDNCPMTANPGQLDRDQNNIGDACEIVAEEIVLDSAPLLKLMESEKWVRQNTPIEIMVQVEDVGVGLEWNITTPEGLQAQDMGTKYGLKTCKISGQLASKGEYEIKSEFVMDNGWIDSQSTIIRVVASPTTDKIVGVITKETRSDGAKTNTANVKIMKMGRSGRKSRLKKMSNGKQARLWSGGKMLDESPVFRGNVSFSWVSQSNDKPEPDMISIGQRSYDLIQGTSMGTRSFKNIRDDDDKDGDD